MCQIGENYKQDLQIQLSFNKTKSALESHFQNSIVPGKWKFFFSENLTNLYNKVLYFEILAFIYLKDLWGLIHNILIRLLNKVDKCNR